MEIKEQNKNTNITISKSVDAATIDILYIFKTINQKLENRQDKSKKATIFIEVLKEYTENYHSIFYPANKNVRNTFLKIGNRDEETNELSLLGNNKNGMFYKKALVKEYKKFQENFSDVFEKFRENIPNLDISNYQTPFSKNIQRPQGIYKKSINWNEGTIKEGQNHIFKIMVNISENNDNIENNNLLLSVLFKDLINKEFMPFYIEQTKNNDIFKKESINKYIKIMANGSKLFVDSFYKGFEYRLSLETLVNKKTFNNQENYQEIYLNVTPNEPIDNLAILTTEMYNKIEKHLDVKQQQYLNFLKGSKKISSIQYLRYKLVLNLFLIGANKQNITSSSNRLPFIYSKEYLDSFLGALMGYLYFRKISISKLIDKQTNYIISDEDLNNYEEFCKSEYKTMQIIKEILENYHNGEQLNKEEKALFFTIIHTLLKYNIEIMPILNQKNHLDIMEKLKEYIEKNNEYKVSCEKDPDINKNNFFFDTTNTSIDNIEEFLLELKPTPFNIIKTDRNHTYSEEIKDDEVFKDIRIYSPFQQSVKKEYEEEKKYSRGISYTLKTFFMFLYRDKDNIQNIYKDNNKEIVFDTLAQFFYGIILANLKQNIAISAIYDENKENENEIEKQYIYNKDLIMGIELLTGKKVVESGIKLENIKNNTFAKKTFVNKLFTLKRDLQINNDDNSNKEGNTYICFIAPVTQLKKDNQNLQYITQNINIFILTLTKDNNYIPIKVVTTESINNNVVEDIFDFISPNDNVIVNNIYEGFKNNEEYIYIIDMLKETEANIYLTERISKINNEIGNNKNSSDNNLFVEDIKNNSFYLSSDVKAVGTTAQHLKRGILFFQKINGQLKNKEAENIINTINTHLNRKKNTQFNSIKISLFDELKVNSYKNYKDFIFENTIDLENGVKQRTVFSLLNLFVEFNQIHNYKQLNLEKKEDEK